MYVSVLGSTGSIGTQTLDVIENLNNNGYNIKIRSLSANRNIEKLKSQIKKFMPDYVCVCDKNLAYNLKHDLDISNIKNIEIFTGTDGLINIAREKVDLVIESNMNFGGCDIPQIANGPLFGDYTQKMIQEVFSRKQNRIRAWLV